MHRLRVIAPCVADEEGWLLELRVRAEAASKEREQWRQALTRNDHARGHDREALVPGSAERAWVLGPREAEDEEAVVCEVLLRRARVVADVAAELEPGVRLLRVGRDDPRARVEVGRAAGHERKPVLVGELAEVTVKRPHSVLDAVQANVFLEKAKADVLRLDAGKPGGLWHAAEDEQTNRPDARAEIEARRHRRALLERIPGGEEIIRRMPMTSLPLKDPVGRRETVDRDRLLELVLERGAALLRFFGRHHRKLVATGILLASSEAAADPRARSSNGGPTASLLDAAWSFGALTIGAELVARTWDAPYPYGQIGRYSTRLVYSGSWAAMMLAETQVVFLAKGGKSDWVGEATWRTDWMVPLDLPTCPRPGAFGGCGVGVGSHSYLQVRPTGSRWWLEAGGGWFQQRVLDDALRTVSESTWVLSPITALCEVHTDRAAPLALTVLAGPGLFFGMHAAHMHPTTRGKEVYPIRWSELYPLDAGIGPGARVEAHLALFRHLGLEANLVVAPFVLGGPVRETPRAIAPLDVDREGVSVWRKLDVGLAWDDPVRLPFKPTVAFFAAELSERPLDRIGYRGVMLRFDVPLRLPSGG